MKRSFLLAKWFALGFGLLFGFIIFDSAVNATQEVTALLIGCLGVLLAIFFHLEQHKS